MVSHLRVSLPENPLTPKNIGEACNGPQRHFCKEYLSVKYDKNKNVEIVLAPIPIKSLYGETKFLCFLIATGIK